MRPILRRRHLEDSGLSQDEREAVRTRMRAGVLKRVAREKCDEIWADLVARGELDAERHTWESQEAPGQPIGPDDEGADNAGGDGEAGAMRGVDPATDDHPYRSPDHHDDGAAREEDSDRDVVQRTLRDMCNALRELDHVDLQAQRFGTRLNVGPKFPVPALTTAASSAFDSETIGEEKAKRQRLLGEHVSVSAVSRRVDAVALEVSGSAVAVSSRSTGSRPTMKVDHTFSTAPNQVSTGGGALFSSSSSSSGVGGARVARLLGDDLASTGTDPATHAHTGGQAQHQKEIRGVPQYSPHAQHSVSGHHGHRGTTAVPPGPSCSFEASDQGQHQAVTSTRTSFKYAAPRPLLHFRGTHPREELDSGAEPQE
ncbi:unnamed protein product [Amoebophrya sp. A120]|nr:unnamed protein product [Amoebophrya sp. A120]|eukprot:GSA120T00010640001.1